MKINKQKTSHLGLVVRAANAALRDHGHLPSSYAVAALATMRARGWSGRVQEGYDRMARQRAGRVVVA